MGFPIVPTIATKGEGLVKLLDTVIEAYDIVPLSPILENPILTPAFDQMLPALFGALGVALVSKNWKIAVAPICLMLALFIFVDALDSGMVGIMVPVGVIFTIVASRIMYKKNLL